MSCLNDIAISNRCLDDRHMVYPFDNDLLQPASYELTFDASLVFEAKDQQHDDMVYDVLERRFKYCSDEDAPISQDDLWTQAARDVYTGGVLIYPGRFYIASSKETLKIPADVMARFEGKSTLGRVGMMVHITAGYIDPGFQGTLTLEIANVAPWPILLRDGCKIGQLSFHAMNDAPSMLYGAPGSGNHYQGQSGPTLPR